MALAWMGNATGKMLVPTVAIFFYRYDGTAVQSGN
jgi:hypothetical protein